jgi:hypothetical protein
MEAKGQGFLKGCATTGAVRNDVRAADVAHGTAGTINWRLEYGLIASIDRTASGLSE